MSAEHDPVGKRATGPGDLPTEHRQLVAQHEDLRRVPVVRSATQDEQLHEAPEHPADDESGRLPIVPATTRTTPHRVLGTHTIDDEVLRAVKVRAARSGMGDSEVIEQALRRELELDLLERLWQRNELDEADAVSLAAEAQHAKRRRRG